MSFIIPTITLVSSIILSIIGFKLLLDNKIFLFLRKKNTGGERWASQSKPIFGGVIFYICFLLALIIALVTQNIVNIPPSYTCILIVTVSLSFFMGLLDDLQTQGPFKKFITQIICAIILIYCDVYIQISTSTTTNYLLTFFWVTGIMNSINMLDNMDAITGSVAGIILLGIIGIILLSPEIIVLDVIILSAIVGSLLVYLYWNWNPSKMYMGDSGSQFLGIILAIYSILYIWNKTPEQVSGYNFYNLILVALAFLLPLIDTCVVFINRLAKGKSPFVGDRFHTTHNLVYLGMSERAVAILFICITIISNLTVWYIISYTSIAIHIHYYIVILACIAIVSTTFFILSRIVQNNNNGN